MAKLISDVLWLIAFFGLLFLSLALAGFSIDDPAWSRALTKLEGIRNPSGLMGAYVSDILYYAFGLSAWVLVFAIGFWLWRAFPWQSKEAKKTPYKPLFALIGVLLLLIFIPQLEVAMLNHTLDTYLPKGAGGLMAFWLSRLFTTFFGQTGSLLLLLFGALIGFSLLLQISWVTFMEKAGEYLEWLWYTLIRRPKNRIKEEPQITRRMVNQTRALTEKPADAPPLVGSNRKKVAIKINKNKASTAPLQVDMFDPETARAAAKHDTLHLPEVKLLDALTKTNIAANPDLLQLTAEKIESTLNDFGVAAEVISASAGPVITRYEIEPAKGVKGSQIINLDRDIARALTLSHVRIVETIAGKSSMGIEIPNSKRQIIQLGEIFSTPIFQQAESKLTMALGKDITGAPVIADLAKMPHLLVAGSTNSGKSVGVNGMILSILFKATPEEVRFIMIDPKMLELSVYEGIPHLLAPVVTDMAKASRALDWCVAEMEKRYRLMSHVQVRTIKSLNEKITEAAAQNRPIPNPFSTNPDEPEPLEKLPFIVVIIDELADLMMVEGKKVEQQITRLAQKARAAGIHLILATQRPSVDVITGLIKANLPTRLSFTVKTKIDSRTILDQAGAETLLGQGDMLFLPPNSPEPLRLHGAFVSDDEVLRVVEFIKSQQGENYVSGLLSGEAASATENKIFPNPNSDELFEQAASFVIEHKKASISSLQRHLRIGYNRAANLMDALETAGIVSAFEDDKRSRTVLVDKLH